MFAGHIKNQQHCTLFSTRSPPKNAHSTNSGRREKKSPKISELNVHYCLISIHQTYYFHSFIVNVYTQHSVKLTGVVFRGRIKNLIVEYMYTVNTTCATSTRELDISCE